MTTAAQESVSAAAAQALAHFQAKLAFEIDPADVWEELQNGGAGLLVVDARRPESSAAEHGPGAVNLPHRLISPETTAALPRDRVIVTYCDGVGCNASTKAAAKLSALGFRVKEMVGGIDWWARRDGHPVEGTGGEAASAETAGPIRCAC